MIVGPAGTAGHTVCGRGDDSGPDGDIDSAHALHLPPSDSRPLPATEFEGVFSHVEQQLVDKPTSGHVAAAKIDR